MVDLAIFTARNNNRRGTPGLSGNLTEVFPPKMYGFDVSGKNNDIEDGRHSSKSVHYMATS